MDELQIRLIPQFWLPICNSNQKLNKKRKFNMIKPSIVCISERGHLTPLTCSIVRSCSHWWSAFLGEEEKWIGRKWQEMFPTWSEYRYRSQDGKRDIFEGNWFLLIRWCFSSDPARLLIGGLLWPWFGRILAAFWSGFALLWPLVRSLFPFGRLVFGRVRGWLELALTEEAGSFFESLLCTFCTSLHILQILFANFCTVLWLVMRGSTCHSSCCEKWCNGCFF